MSWFRAIVAPRRGAAWMAALALAFAAGCRPELTGISVSPPDAPLPEAWSELRFRATGHYADGTAADITSEASWSSSDPSIATAGPGGGVRGVRRGETVVTASVDRISGSATVQVPAFRDLGATSFEMPPNLGAMRMAGDAAGDVLLVLTSQPEIATRRATGPWPPSWTTLDAGISDASSWNPELAVNTAGAAALVYRTSDPFRFGVAYFDGEAWAWHLPIDGALHSHFGTLPDSTCVAIDDQGRTFVAYEKVVDGRTLNALVIARFDADGLIDVTEFAEPVNDLYVASAGGRVMVLNTATGSRLFDGIQWGALNPLSGLVYKVARLGLADAGTAELVHLDAVPEHYGFDGTSWMDPVPLTSQWVRDASVAFGPSGTIMVSFVSGSGAVLTARHFDGATWRDPVDLDGAAPPAGPAPYPMRVLADGTGRYVALWQSGYGIKADYFDGAWHEAQVLHYASIIPTSIVVRPDGQIAMLELAPSWEGGSYRTATFQFAP